MALRQNIEASVYILLFLTSGCLIVVFGPLVALGLGLVSSGFAELTWMLMLVGAWPLTLAVVATTLVASLVVLGFGSWRQRLRVTTWYATVGVFYWLAADARPLTGALGLILQFGLVCYWLIQTHITVALWTFEICSLVVCLTALLVLAIEPLWWVGALATMAAFGLCAFWFASKLVAERRSRRPVGS